MNLLDAINAWLVTHPTLSWEQLTDLLDGDIDDPATADGLRKLKVVYLDFVFGLLKTYAPWLNMFAGGILRNLYSGLIDRGIDWLINNAKRPVNFRK